jgi:hypothetical protein
MRGLGFLALGTDAWSYGLQEVVRTALPAA